MPRPSLHEQRLKLRAWEDKLWNLLTEMQEANGESDTDLEALVRISWKEARRERERVDACLAGP